MKNAVAILLILVGLITLIYSFILALQRTSPNRLSFPNYRENTKTVSKSKTTLPKRLIIKSLGIDLFVETAKIKNHIWPVSETGVSYLFSSSEVGQTGNTIFYGHNFENLLGRLQNAKVGNVIEIQTQNNKIHKYQIYAIAIVKPSETQVLNQSKKAILTLYTCSGSFDQNRLVVSAKLIRS